MKKSSIYLGFLNGILTLGILVPAMAQVTSDGTTQTTINRFTPPGKICQPHYK